MKKISMISTIALLVSLVTGAHGVIALTSVEDEQWPSQFAAVAGLHGFELDEVSGLRDNVSVLIGSDSNGQKLCTAASSAGCESAAGYSFRAVLGPCTSSVTIDCIESVVATKGDGTSVNGAFKQFFPARGVTDFRGSPTEGVPDGGPPSLWTMAGAPHAFGSDYEVAVQVVGSKVNGDALKPLRSFSANITPVEIYQTQCNPLFHGLCMDTYSEKTESTGKTSIRFGGVAADIEEEIRCVNWGENAKCALKHAFPAGIKFALKVRLNTTPTGWLHGRLKDPTASITRTENVTTITVSAEPTKIPIVSGVGQWTTLPAPIQEWFTSNCPNNCGTRLGLSADPLVRNAISGPAAFSDAAFSQLKLWSTFTGDKAVALPSQWSVRTLSYSEMVKAPACIKDGVGVTGIVATNASAYSEGPPTFDPVTSSLNYKVAAPHFEKDGVTPFNGQYNLILRSDIANCLYGVSDSTKEASVSVTGEDGVAKSATTAFSYNNGWFSFSAKGFTHSAPTIKVKLTSPQNDLKVYLKRLSQVKKGTVTTKAKLLVLSGLKYKSTSRWYVQVSTPKICRVTGTGVKNLKAGACKLLVYVTPVVSKTVPKPKTVRARISLKVS